MDGEEILSFYGGSNGDTGKNLIPLEKSFVRGKDRGCLLIPSGGELEKQIGSLDGHRQIPGLVNDKHPVPGQDFEPVLKVGFLELLNELAAVDVVGREPALTEDTCKAELRAYFKQLVE